MSLKQKVLSVLSTLVALLLLVGCGAGASSASVGAAPAQHGSTADYKAVIQASRDSALNESALYDIVTAPSDPLHDMIFSSFGFVAEDYDRYAISAGSVITIAYGVFIILPKQGRHDAVQSQVEAFVQQQQKAMENYLQDQFEIAKGAIIKTAPTGEILLAMCADAETVMANMEAGLAAG